MLRMAAQPLARAAAYPAPDKLEPRVATISLPSKSMDQLAREVRELFTSKLTIPSLLNISLGLQQELRQHLVSSPQCMLPSFNYTLPSGREQGTYLAVEVGGSNLRIALVELNGRSNGTSNSDLTIRRHAVAPITRDVKEAHGYAFFDWTAAQIKEMLLGDAELRQQTKPVPMGIAWSFPIDQTSIRSGNVLGMGKGFLCSNLIQGHDLGDIIMQACQRVNVNVRLDAIVNDTSSALLARAYLDPATRLAVVLGTGMNAAVHLPIAALHPSKFGDRASKVSSHATHVLTNTEFSMFGKGTFPTTKWDNLLNSAHRMPDYQPFEYLIAGGYMGEIVRLILVEASQTAGLYGGILPTSLHISYNLDTRTLAEIHIDSSPSLLHTRELLQRVHPSSYTQPSLADARFVQEVVRCVAQRSIAFFATGVHALTALLQQLDDTSTDLDHITIGCDGSVINKYPKYMETAQRTLDLMTEQLDGNGGAKKDGKRILLEKTQQSAVLGAGVAVGLANYEKIDGDTMVNGVE